MTMNELIEIYISCFEFTDIGIELLASENIPSFDNAELTVVANYFSIIFGQNLCNNFNEEGSGKLFGPLPVAYRNNMLSLIYGSTIRDKKLKDERIIQNDHYTPFFVMIFFPTEFDHLFSISRVSISKMIDKWCSTRYKVEKITIDSLTELKNDLQKLVLNYQAHLLNSPDINYEISLDTT
jgi:hypothetical protein